MTPEGDVKKDIKEWLDGQKIYYFMPVQTGYGKRTVDFLICWRGWFLAVEAKRARGRPRRFQEQVLRDVAGSGGLAVYVDSLARLQEFLAEFE